ncbi:chondroitin AC/alginate lyase [Cristinia sonorae]|uniref:Chondroitin AC/alginate lyase n=1 Tax=Cristinia sonorae TaxID=1940300 RepID=A0A8K0UQC0_9AGAR|nr:chondroitin AC/alginate lyase [Cristinia sonorae]
MLFTSVPAVHSFYSYSNDFVDPTFILARNFSPSTILAQKTILKSAVESAASGPWSVTNKSIIAPTGDKHDYMSWAPYWWPDCSKAGNTTELSPQQIWTTCAYVSRDGQFNPDVRTSGVNDVGNFADFSDAVFYNSLAWAINGSSVYAANVARFIDYWFINPETAMNPNLEYAQMQRGPDGQKGTHTGLLDLKSMAKIVPGVLILREGKAPEWTADLDAQFVNWTNSYLPWLTTAKLAIEEEESLNNHGSFYFNQLAALQILVGDKDGAKETIEKFFKGIYQGQIAANGDQPFESARTRPYHYRAYNLGAMLTNARLGQYVGYDAWNVTTKAGSTIKDACDYAMTQPAGDEDASELYSIVNAIGAVYGDPDGKYAKYLLQNAGKSYPEDASFLWNQPMSDSGLVKTGDSGSSVTDPKSDNGAGTDFTVKTWVAVCVTLMGISLFELF